MTLVRKWGKLGGKEVGTFGGKEAGMFAKLQTGNLLHPEW